jgi:hypothetical protein
MRRAELLQLTEAALAHGSVGYALKIVRGYLTEWPGDLEAQTLLARAYLAEGNVKRAIRLLQSVTAVDPEQAGAQRLLASALAPSDAAAAREAEAAAHVVDGRGVSGKTALPAWAMAARAGRTAAAAKNAANASIALSAQTDNPLPALIHLAALTDAKHHAQALPLAEAYVARWPRVIAFKLVLAGALMHTGDHARAIDLLHEAAAHDVAGQVAERYFGAQHPYQALWPTGMAADVPGPIPAELITGLGLNRLHTAAPSRLSSKAGPRDGDLFDIQASLDLVADKLGLKARKSTSDDLYLLVSSRQRLTLQFGEDGFRAIDEQARLLAETQQIMRGQVVYVDDADSVRAFGLTPVDPNKAWDVKLLIAEIAAKQKQQGRKLGALLIVGGPEIVPFHHLPNPVDDPDPDVPSDNPYATADDNYFAPEWPIGRMPSGGGRDAGPLVRCLKRAVSVHARKNLRRERQPNWLEALLAVVRRWLKQAAGTAPAASFGYSANVWRLASQAVYDLIGDPRELQTSPPTESAALPAEGLAPSKLSYFNLHGVEDGAEWYGQRAPGDPASAPEYPVALRPTDVTNHGRAPQIVFSEACYGANIFNKVSVDEALCLRFLDMGTRAMVGSTKIAYGSVSTPLICADLLGKYFWQHLTAGMAIGESLRLAKLAFAQDTNQRQGALDGEDQKTLISFVLYGDPLVTVKGLGNETAAKEAKRRALAFTGAVPEIHLAETQATEVLSAKAMAEVKSLVAQYLPGMEDADVRAARARVLPFGAKALTGGRSTVVTLSKSFPGHGRLHPHYARVTVDASGKLIKLAVSR